MPGSEGIVHGHIHNFNNITYIHGHVHESASLQPESTSLEQFAQYTYPAGADTPVVPNLPLSPTGSGPLSSEQHDNCQLFEFMNCHNLNIFGEDNQLPTPQIKKRKTRECDTCEPNIMELCCDEEHEQGETPHTITIPDHAPPIAFPGHQTYTNANGLVAQDASSSLNMEDTTANDRLPSFIGCNMTCLPRKSEEDTFYEKFCEQCVDLDQDQAQCSEPQTNPHSHSSLPIVDEAPIDIQNSSSPPHLYTNVPHNHNHDQTLNYESAHSSRCHDHVMNSSTDMMVMKDLVNISNMYDFPFGKHFHPHENSSDVNLNLLQTSIPGSKSGLRKASPVKSSHDHHHHSLELHSHPIQSFSSPSELCSNGENNSSSSHRRPSFTVEKLHHAASPQKISQSDVKNSTINFNWIYKNEHQNIECGWNHCPEVYDSLLELQSHVLKDHVVDSNPNDTKLPTPRNYFCEWTDCAFEGDDLCTLINHINGEHGVAFDMKCLDREKLLEQNDHQHALHCEECPDFTSSQTSSIHGVAVTPQEDGDHENNHEHVHDCQWNGCGLKFNSCAELNDHIEAVHIPRGRSSYVCEWENCGKTITQRQKLLRHLRVHTRYKPCKCPHCSKTFSTQDILLQHIRTHSGEKPYKCSHCGKGFATSSSLRIHIRTHTGEKPLECKVCGKRFNESSNLSKHMRTHERKYKCNGCKRSFDLAEQLEVHQHRCSHCATFKKYA
ncbi:LAFA_0F11936g1_1 [Lachancea sp. 'fantastica']|nr:LAFA_0F11936g1_1 [Lachancea sp. 'fantastica']